MRSPSVDINIRPFLMVVVVVGRTMDRTVPSFSTAQENTDEERAEIKLRLGNVLDELHQLRRSARDLLDIADQIATSASAEHSWVIEELHRMHNTGDYTSFSIDPVPDRAICTTEKGFYREAVDHLNELRSLLSGIKEVADEARGYCAPVFHLIRASDTYLEGYKRRTKRERDRHETELAEVVEKRSKRVKRERGEKPRLDKLDDTHDEEIRTLQNLVECEKEIEEKPSTFGS
jgi:hypothetical protein